MKICRNERNVLKWKFRVWSPEYIKTLQRNFISGYYSQNSWNVIKIKTVLVHHTYSYMYTLSPKEPFP